MSNKAISFSLISQLRASPAKRSVACERSQVLPVEASQTPRHRRPTPVTRNSQLLVSQEVFSRLSNRQISTSVSQLPQIVVANANELSDAR